MDDITMTTFDYVRGVSGRGPRCGCGGESTLHVGYGQADSPGIFLCRACVTEAVAQLLAHQPQHDYWPGDEGRDERYQSPVIDDQNA